ncbi:hypothetical protein [Sphingomonas sp. GV3]|jgi:cell division protein FtsB|uniref:hypothetical protein n=1 Tax=Sphingomonas sp. GV3 TaxID=3040671 RepID=UPI00280B83DD|nr:hypothetical protein [Sphingomonas sp. GV3]
MKLTDLIYHLVVAFRPDKRPWVAMLALTLLLVAFATIVISLALVGRQGAAALHALVML